MRYRLLTHAELHRFTQEFADRPVWPISPIRALSYSHNPQARSADPALFLAFDEQENLLAYLGSLPDSWHIGDTVQRCAWLSCLWVHPAGRGKGLAKQLLRMALDAWEERIMLTEFSPSAEQLYVRSGWFTRLASRNGWRLYRRTDLEGLMDRRFAGQNILSRGGRLIDQMSESVIGWKEKIRMAPLDTEYTLRELKAPLDPASWSFIDDFSKNALSLRRAVDLEWMMQYPWLEEAEPNEQSKKYYFSSVARQFEQGVLGVYRKRNPAPGDTGLPEEARPSGILHYTLRDGVMKLPYVFLEPGAIHPGIAATMQFMASRKAHTLLSFHPDLLQGFHERRYGMIHRRQASRHFFVSNKLHEQLLDAGINGIAAPLPLQDGDGDAAFT